MSNESQGTFYFTDLPNGWQVGRFAVLDELGLIHAVTTRKGFDVAAAGEDPKAAASAVADALGLRGIAYCHQVHGRQIVVPRRGGSAGRADGMVTVARGLGLMGLAADCPLILAADPVSGAVGLAHASWRGTVTRIASELVSQLVSRFRADSADIVACICPSAGPCCYEVGPDVVQRAAAELGLRAQQFVEKRGPKTYFDLWAANIDELAQAGLDRENIHTAGICTICRNDLFPSHRAEHGQAGRFVAAIAQS